jgi:hypothetical protein
MEIKMPFIALLLRSERPSRVIIRPKVISALILESLVDINKIDHRADPKAAKSLLELFILVIIKNLGLNAK